VVVNGPHIPFKIVEGKTIVIFEDDWDDKDPKTCTLEC
jgi:hypothetical protein